MLRFGHRRLVAAAGLIGLVLLGISGLTDALFDSPYLLGKSIPFLDRATEEAFGTFLVLSGLKSGLALLQSSSAGISFIVDVDVQVGEVLHSIKEVVDYGWSASLISLSVLAGIRILLEFLHVLSPLLLYTSLIALGACCCLVLIGKKTSQLLVETLHGIICLTLFISLGLPLAVYVASLTSQTLTAPYRTQIQTELNRHRMVFEGIDGNLKEQAHSAASKLSEKSKSLHRGQRDLTGEIVRHLVVVAFDAVVFPTLFFGLVLVGFRRVIRSLKGILEGLGEEIRAVEKLVVA